MKIQSLSVCVPSGKCINNCKFCCAKMSDSLYKDQITDNLRFYDLYRNDYIKRMEFARDNGCNTCMLTGNVEPQQNISFLKAFGDMNKELERPFRNIEIQTTGAFIDDEKLRFLRNQVGVTTISVSVSCLNNNSVNKEIIGMRDEKFDLKFFCSEIKRYDFNLRLSLNITNNLFLGKPGDNMPFLPRDVFDYCKTLGADQVTFRKMYVSNDNATEQNKWLAENLDKSIELEFFPLLNKEIKEHGVYLDTLEYGSDRYSYEGMSVVIDTDCMSKGINKDAVKYLILRPNCKLYSKWDDKGSLIF
jgi:hypothetical protein